MIKALNTAATGLEAQQANLDRIANDLANANTDGYKRDQIEFKDLMYENVKTPGQAMGASTTTPVGIQKGMGVKVGSMHKNFEQGSVKVTNNPYDLMIEGKGFLPVQNPSTGEILFTRAGSFKSDPQGRIVTSGGYVLQPQINIPSEALSVKIYEDGVVKAMTADGDNVIGQIQLSTFVNPQGLVPSGNNLYKTSMASGNPIQSVPGENGTGTLLQGALESSNVNVANSMIDMIGTQRTYEMNTRVMGVADKMLEATSNIVR